jgi:hypothetical protein
VADVHVDVEHIRQLAKQFITWGQDIDSLTTAIDNMKITPGWVPPNGSALRKRFEDRRGEFSVALKNLQTIFNRIGNELSKIADKYFATDDLNKDDINRVKDLIDSVSVYFPGVKDVVPSLYTAPTQ